MNTNTNTEDLLEWLEKENNDYRNHWVFRELKCTPEQLYDAAEQYSQEHQIEIPDQYKAPKIAQQINKQRNQIIKPHGNLFILRA